VNREIAYLDYNATAPAKPEVIVEVSRIMTDGGNPSSVHSVGRRAKSILEKARTDIALMLNARPQMVIFTSGGTEANNIALKSLDLDNIIISATEHDSILQIAENLSLNVESSNVEICPVDENGLVREEALDKILSGKKGKTLVSIMLANNETGVIQDIKTLSTLVHEKGALMHTDAIQAFGKIPLDFKALGVDMMSLSAHKIGGPQGVGALIAHESLKITPLIAGGGQEVGRRSGTENLAGIAGFAKAVELVPQSLQKMDFLGQERDRMEGEISQFSNEVIFFGKNSPRLPNTSLILMPEILSETQVMAFDLENICISSGSACSSGKVKPSHVIAAMGGSERAARSTIRFSLGWNSSSEDVDRFVAAWIKLYSRKKV